MESRVNCTTGRYNSEMDTGTPESQMIEQEEAHVESSFFLSFVIQ